MKHVLVAGHGFVGKEIAKLFRARGWQVSTLSRGGDSDYQADLTDLASLQSLARQLAGVDVLVHCASAGGSGDYRGVYYHGVKNLISAFPSVKPYFTSSTSVYPQVDGSEVTEISSTEQEREGGRILVESEQLVLGAGGVVLRLAGLYGEGRSFLLRRFFSGDSKIEEAGDRLMNHTHHEDAADAMWFIENRCPSVSSEIYNVCDSSPISQLATYQHLCAIFQKPLPASGPRPEFSKRGWSNKAVSNKKLRSLGWEPLHPSFVEAAPAVAISLGLI